MLGQKTCISFFFYLILSFVTLNISAQKRTTYNTRIEKAINVTVYRNITEDNKNKILLINKYIDTSKEILVFAGSNTIVVSMLTLRRGSRPLGGDLSEILEIKLIKNQLFISANISNIDGTIIAKIKDNRLLPSSKKYIQYSSERFIEIYNDYHIPVLQLNFDKKKNSISIAGLFYDREGYRLFSKTECYDIPYGKPFLLLPLAKRDSILDETVQLSKRLLKPLHE